MGGAGGLAGGGRRRGRGGRLRFGGGGGGLGGGRFRRGGLRPGGGGRHRLCLRGRGGVPDRQQDHRCDHHQQGRRCQNHQQQGAFLFIVYATCHRICTPFGWFFLIIHPMEKKHKQRIVDFCHVPPPSPTIYGVCFYNRKEITKKG
ncbi:MAG: hypothetical protein E7527_06065 [Ruminococcaceae bacterium]|nr:hypothetical protein [Oscillospiraceae bacterium]